MSRTDELFTFELNLGAGEGCMTEEGLEDTVYNCLDFCLLCGKTPHFYLGGDDPLRHPSIWTVLELLREEGGELQPPERAGENGVRAEPASAFRRKQSGNRL